MKKLYILASLIIGAFAFASCEYADTTPEYKAPTTFVLNTPAAVNGTYNLESSDYVVLTCSQPDYGYTAGVSYEVQVCLSEEFKSEVAKDNPEGNYITLKTKYNAAKLNVKAYTLADMPSRHLRRNTLHCARLHALAAALSALRPLANSSNANVFARLLSSISRLFLKFRKSLNGDEAGNVPPPTW